MEDRIYKTAQSLVRRFGTSDPFEIAEGLGIELTYSDRLERLSGRYMYILRNAYIVINSNLSEERQRIVCAHELGHDRLHRAMAAKSGVINEIGFLDMTTRPEYEANVFAGELLYSDGEIAELIEEGRDLFQMAAGLFSDASLIALKLAQMKKRGFAVNIDLSFYDRRFIEG